MDNVVHTSVSRARLRQTLARLPQSAETNAAILTRLGLTLLGRIKQAFIIKARGGTDEAGERWQPLSPKTVAYSRRGRTRAEKRRESRPSQGLTKKQQDRWWQLYRKFLAVHKGNKQAAAKIAWHILKREGATTLLQKYGNRQVEILRDTGLLLNSLSPGVSSDSQVFRVGSGEVTVGTNRRGAAAHHHGVPGRLPQRRLWPDPSKWPPSWWQELQEQVKQELIDIALREIRGA